MQKTPNSQRLHIGVFGKTNSGKSSFINAFTHQKISIVSDVAGTTTDPVYKAMEIAPIGPVVFIDTAGFQDQSELGKQREEKTKDVLKKVDIAIVLFQDEYLETEDVWMKMFKEHKIPVIPVISFKDVKDQTHLKEVIKERYKINPILISSITNEGLEEVKEALIRHIPEDYDAKTITGNLLEKTDVVMLVMPQDIQAPKGRLILPQVQTLRELLDKKCIVLSVTTDQYINGLNTLKEPPKLIITDSQVFDYVYEHKPEKSLLTSFSVLFANYKGDIHYYKDSASAIASLNCQSHVLIAECCSHAPLEEDIGRVKIPRMLKQKYGVEHVDIVSGVDFPDDLSDYDLIIQCGGCMFNRKYILSRMQKAKEQHIPMTNYGITIAYLKGILDKVTIVE